MEALETVRAVIGGDRALASETIQVLDPSTGRAIAAIPRCGAEEVDRAVSAARRAFVETWRGTTAEERSVLLRRIGTLIRRDLEELGRQESLETGMPLGQARADALAAARYFEFYADTVRAQHGDVVPAASADMLLVTLREPHGVTAHIVPWNYPLQLTARSIAPALAAGNCTVVKPSSEAPLGPIRIVELAIEAGLPDGVCNIVPGFGEEVGLPLARHPGIDHVAFTGSPEAGIAVSQAAAGHYASATLELGGKSPNILFDDADLDEALPAVVESIVDNAGQACGAGSRLLVASSIRTRVVDALVARFEAVRVGAGLADLDMGPLISARQRDRVAAMVSRGAQDARLLTGGSAPTGSPFDDGFFFRPTLFDGVPPDASIAQEEVFGPVLAVIPFDDERDAVRIANGTPYGLVAGVWTRDVDRAFRLAREIRAGQVFINSYGAGVEAPFGGAGRSGFGREKGVEAYREYTQTKAIAVRIHARVPA